MGLITKAIRKVEKKESLIPQMDEEPKPKRKRKFVLVVAAVLFIGACLGLGYSFLLKPTTQAPPKISHRSLSTKKKTEKLALGQLDKNKVSVGVKATASTQEVAFPDSSKESVAQQKPAKDGEVITEPKKVMPAPEQRRSDILSEGPTSPLQKEPESPKSEVKGSSETANLFPSPQEEEIPRDVTSYEGKKQNPLADVTDETAPMEEEEMPSEQVTPLPALELKEWLAQKPFTVTEKSDSRAQRYYNKGVSYQKQGEIDQAIRAYREALAFNPDHQPAHMNLATAYLQTGRLKEAEQELIYLYALKPKDRKILFNLGLLLFQTGELASAETKLEKVLELDPFFLEAHLLLASVYEEKGELKKAVECCIKAYEINSADSRVLYRLGRGWDLAGEPVKAITYYRLFLNSPAEKEAELKLAVYDRLNYLIGRKEKE